MIDIKAAEKEAKDELAKERITKAKKQIKEKLNAIEKARSVVRALERDYELLLAEIGGK